MTISKEFKWFILFSILFVMGLALRIMFIPARTLDMEAYLKWYSYITRKGIVQSLGSQHFGYNPPFIYLLVIATLTQSFLQPLVAIKFIPIIFDVLSAILIYQIVKTHHQEETKPILAALIFWVAPTVMVNSSFWGQTDSLYTSFLLLTVFLLIKEKPTLALAAFALSIAIKAQGILIAPFLAILFFKKQISIYSFFIVPFVYAATFIPTLLAGRPINSLLSTYEVQGETFAKASLNAANFYYFIGESGYKTALYAGIPLAVVILLAWVLIYGYKKYELTRSTFILSALISVALAPFVLPKMHDRYFYPADVFSIAAVFFLPELWFIPIAYQVISLISYMPYLFNIPGNGIMPFAVVINAIAILFLLWKQWTLTNEK